MTTEPKFWKTTLVVEVLSEREIPDHMSLSDIAIEMDVGDFVGRVKDVSDEEVTGQEMANLLYDFGSDPGFFMLNDNGEPTDD